MIKRLLFKLIYRACNWAMNVKGGEDATKVGIYYIQEWE